MRCRWPGVSRRRRRLPDEGSEWLPRPIGARIHGGTDGKLEFGNRRVQFGEIGVADQRPACAEELPVRAAGDVGGQRRVVRDDQRPVASDRDVGLERVDTDRQREHEAGDRVLGRQSARTAVALQIEGLGRQAEHTEQQRGDRGNHHGIGGGGGRPYCRGARSVRRAGAIIALPCAAPQVQQNVVQFPGTPGMDPKVLESQTVAGICRALGLRPLSLFRSRLKGTASRQRCRLAGRLCTRPHAGAHRHEHDRDRAGARTRAQGRPAHGTGAEPLLSRRCCAQGKGGPCRLKIAFGCGT
jgi:hypothetical protein